MQPAFVILGSGQDGGSPQLGHRSGTGAPRTASSVGVRTPGGSIVLLDATPDITNQCRRLMDWVDYPNDRAALLDAVAITHGHMGHYIGLLHFGPESANVSRLPLLVTPRFSAFMAENDPFRALISGNHMVPRNLLAPMRIDETAEVVGIPVPHRAEYTDTVAISIRVHGEPWLCYLPDIDSWQDWPDAESVLGQHNYALIDATFTSTAEVPGRNIAEIPHPFVTDTIERFAHLTSSTSIVLTHINHSNPVADPSSTIAKKARARGFHIARDGLASSEI